MKNPTASVVLEGVQHRFDTGRFLFHPVTRRFHPGIRYALLGPSGSGKSTLLSIIAGWLVPSEGSVVRASITKTGWVFQNPHGSARRSTLDHVTLPLLARGMTRREAETEAMDILTMFSLHQRADSPFSALSGGEAQRLMLARAVTTAPDLLLVDEPTAQLDAVTAHTVIESLRWVSITGSIVIIATHDTRMRDACDEIIELEPSV